MHFKTIAVLFLLVGCADNGGTNFDTGPSGRPDNDDDDRPDDDDDTERPDDDDTERPDDDDTDPPVNDDSCEDDDECGAFEICWDECEPALDRSYRVTVHSISATTLDANGQYWDIAGGAPDFAVYWGTFDSDGDWLDDCYATAPIDSFSGSISRYCDVVLSSGDGFGIYIYEEDVASDLYVRGWAWESNDGLTSWARMAGLGTWTLTDDTVTLTVSVAANY